LEQIGYGEYCPHDLAEGVVTIQREDEVDYRFIPGETIDRWDQETQTWQVAYDLDDVQVKIPYYNKLLPGLYPTNFRAGPFDARFDPASGNLIFAMGLEGVLVYTADSEWVWVAVGNYQRPDDLYHPITVLRILTGELALAVGFGLLVLCTLWIWFRRRRLVLVMLILWVILLSLLIVFPPALTSGYDAAIPFYTIPIMGVILIPSSGVCAYQIWAYSRELLVRILKYAVAGVVLFALPFILWGFNVLPDYKIAVFFSFLIGGVVVYLVYTSVRDALDKDPIEAEDENNTVST
jgi:hypothetical protein